MNLYEKQLGEKKQKNTIVQQMSQVFSILIKLAVLQMEFVCFLIRIDYFSS